MLTTRVYILFLSITITGSMLFNTFLLDAMNADQAYSGLGELENVAVVVVYNSGYPAVVHKLTQRRIQLLKQQWLTRLNAYKLSTLSTTL